MNRAAQDQTTDIHPTTDVPSIDPTSIFQPAISPARTHPENPPFELHQQQSFLTSALSNDRTSLREQFQRIKISGDVHDTSHIEDLEDAVGPLLRALVIREKYFLLFSLKFILIFFYFLKIYVFQ